MFFAGGQTGKGGVLHYIRPEPETGPLDQGLIWKSEASHRPSGPKIFPAAELGLKHGPSLWLHLWA